MFSPNPQNYIDEETIFQSLLYSGIFLQTMMYSAVRMKPDKKYLKFFWVFPQITRVMRSLSIKNNCRNASKNEKITIF